MNTESVECRVFDSEEQARKYGKGGIYYTRINGSQKQFPRDVAEVNIMMPYNSENSNTLLSFICLAWPTIKPLANGSRWSLDGSVEKPTMTPSLNWVDQWHGWLTDGRLESC